MRTWAALAAVAILAMSLLSLSDASSSIQVSLDRRIYAEDTTAVMASGQELFVGTADGTVLEARDAGLHPVPGCAGGGAALALIDDLHIDASGTTWAVSQTGLAWRLAGQRCWQAAWPWESTSTRLVDSMILDDVLGVRLGDGSTHSVRLEGGSIVHQPAAAWPETRSLLGYSVDAEERGTETLVLASINDVHPTDTGEFVATSRGLFFVPIGEPVEPLRDPLIEGRFHLIETLAPGVIVAAGTSGLFDVANVETPIDTLSDLSGPISDIALDEDGTIWVASFTGLYRLPADSVTVATDGIPEGSISNVVADELVVTNDFIYVNDTGMWRETTECEDEQTATPLALSNVNDVVAVGQDFIAATNTGLALISHARGCISHLGGDVNEANIKDIHVDPSGRVWAIAAPAVLFVADADAPTSFNKVEGVDGNQRGKAVFSDPSGDLVISTESDGPRDVIAESDSSIELGPVDAELSGVLLRDFATTQDDVVAVATRARDTGIVSLARREWLIKGDFTINVTATSPSGGPLLWIGTSTGLLAIDTAYPTGCALNSVEACETLTCNSPNARCARFSDGLLGQNILDIDVHDDGSVWVATSAGLAVHWDAGIAPLEPAITLKLNGEPCIDCDFANLPWDTKTVELVATTVDLGDWTGTRVELTADGEPLVAGALATTPGETYSIEATALDRHFNASVSDANLTLDPKPLAEKAKHPAVLIPAVIAAVFLVAFVRSRIGLYRRRTARLSAVPAADNRTLDVRLMVDGRRGRQRLLHEASIEIEGAGSLSGSSLLSAIDPVNELGKLLDRQGRRRLTRLLLFLEDGDAPSAERLSAVVQAQALPWESLELPDGELLSERGLVFVRMITPTAGDDEAEPVEAALEPSSPRRPTTMLFAQPSIKPKEPLNDLPRIDALSDALGSPLVKVLPFEDRTEFLEVLENGHDDEAGSDRAAPWDIVAVHVHGTADGSLDRFGHKNEGERANSWNAHLGAHRAPRLWLVLACNAGQGPSLMQDRNRGPMLRHSPAQQLVRSGAGAFAIGFADAIGNETLKLFYEALLREIRRHPQLDVAVRKAIATAMSAQNEALTPERNAIRLYASDEDLLLANRRSLLR